MTSVFINGLPQRVGPVTSQIILQFFFRFHSIGCPSEWGRMRDKMARPAIVEFPFNWLPQRVGPGPTDRPFAGEKLCFHSIGCPSEWGLLVSIGVFALTLVSIQLVAPASGARSSHPQRKRPMDVSIQLVAPASGAYPILYRTDPDYNTFPFNWLPFNWLPQRVGPVNPNQYCDRRFYVFPFNWLPQRVGPVFSRWYRQGREGEFPFNWLPQRVGPQFV